MPVLEGEAQVTDHVVVDVEIQTYVGEGGLTWDDTDKLGVACACVWQYVDCRLRVYGPDDVAALRERLLRADRITTFNGWRFDFPCIWGIARRHWDGRCADLTSEQVSEIHDFLKPALVRKSNDLLRRIWQAQGLDPDAYNPSTHGGFSLDTVARATLGVGKIGHGADAPKWFQAGQWARVVNYCADDTCLERDLSDLIDRYGYILSEQDGKLRRIRLAPWEGGK
jgi:DEAD/DEAH box helicase domain-containing protein